MSYARALPVGGSGARHPNIKYVTPISCLVPGCCIHAILYFKNVPPLLRNPSDGSGLIQKIRPVLDFFSTP